MGRERPVGMRVNDDGRGKKGWGRDKMEGEGV